ncbi:MAG: response regulator [Ruminococcus sp.]|uniref:response regulator n=1 Tax=Schaedlerella arabinosiphila TaxID=2044587 RepID=UPI002557F293|nr:response regulator [Schaedlerella arabinosiphila]MCI9604160.1 response regulator [Ruminococcus sp.]
MHRILVADDVEINREILRDMLMDDYIVEIAEDGAQAVQKLQECPDGIAALLLDLQMPNMDGYAVLDWMNEHKKLKTVPVLIISSERSAAIENYCFELGVSDFIHKPFNSSIVKKRVDNIVELFDRKNGLEQKVAMQTRTLEEQRQIIRLHTRQLRDTRIFNDLMMQYRSAIMVVEAKLKVLYEEFAHEYNRNPFESIKSRLKSPESIYEKLDRKGFPITVESIREHLFDVAGVRVICSFPDDIYRLANLVVQSNDIILVQKKDYIKNPKSNGYRSLHLILDVPIFLSIGKQYIKVEMQFRTIAMDFWASLEHKLKYKKDVENTEEIERQLKVCADSIDVLDYQMMQIRSKIDKGNTALLTRDF